MAYHPFRHLGLKFLALAVAFGLWFTVAGEETVERTLKAPLELRNRPERLELVETAPPSVDVRVRGRSGLLSQLDSSDALAMLDLSTAKAGRRYFSLSRRQVSVPFGVEVVEVSPGTIPLRFESSATREVPVSVVLDGEPAEGYLAGTPIVQPPTVSVTGPLTAVHRLREVVTEPVSIAGARQTVRETATIGMPDASLKLDQPVAAVVTVPVAALPIDRKVSLVPVHLRNARKGMSAQVTPAEVDVTVRGPSEIVSGLRADALTAFVDLAGRGPGRYNLTVRVDPGHDYVIVGISPAAVAVRVR